MLSEVSAINPCAVSVDFNMFTSLRLSKDCWGYKAIDVLGGRFLITKVGLF